MRLKLHNFRCHTDKEFTFPDSGLVLIEGLSGCGKSTIFEAIYYAFYGTLQSTFTYNTSRCSVELEFRLRDSVVTIFRQRGPSRLVVNHGQLVDDEAQGYIDGLLREGEFLSASYIRQKTMASLLDMPPRRQLEFIESLAFDETHVKEITGRITGRIQLYRQLLAKTVAELRVYTEMGKSEPERRGRAVKDPAKLASNIEVLRSRISVAESDLADKNRLYRDTVSKLTQRREQERLRARATELESRLAREPEIRAEHKRVSKVLRRKRRYLTYVEDKKKRDKLESTVSQMRADIMKSWVDEIVSLKSSIEEQRDPAPITQEIERLREYKQNSTLLRDALRDVSEGDPESVIADVRSQCASLPGSIESDRDSMESLKKAIDSEEVRRTVQPCPSCATPLRVDAGQIVVSAAFDSDRLDALRAEYKVVKKRLRKFEKRLEKYRGVESLIDSLYTGSLYSATDEGRLESLQTELESVRRVRAHNAEVRMQLDRVQESLQMERWPPSVTRLERELTGLSLNECEDPSPDEDLDVLMTRVATLTSELERVERDKEELAGIHLVEFGALPDPDELRREIEAGETYLQTTKEKLKKFEAQEMRHNEFESYKREYTEFMEWTEKVTHLRFQEDVYQKKLTAALLIQEKSLEAQALTIQYTVNMINATAKFYLDEMFEDDISVTIETFKLTKSKQLRTQINVRILYRGAETTLKALSGGEQDRVSMAFVLAMCEIYNPPVLMLDECISSLDSETTSEIVDSIKRLAGDRPVFIIAHQAVSGMFDSVIHLR